MRKIAVVVGASSGLGEECARQLARSADVTELWLVARREDRLQRLASELSVRPCRVLALDMTDPTARRQLRLAAEQAGSEDGVISWLVLAAGCGRVGRLGDEAPAAEQMIRLNVAALTALAADLLPLTRGHALFFSSVAAFLPQPNFAVYAASKAYVLSLAQALNHEFTEVTVTAVCPNPVETEFFAVAGHELKGLKKLAAEKAAKVVQTAIRRARKGRYVSISHPLARGLRLAGKLLPQRLLLWLARGMWR